MRYRSLLVLLTILAASCGSTQTSSSAPPLQLKLAQTGGSTDMYYFRGAVPVQFALQISNPTNQSYTLRRLNLQTIGPGAYSLRTGDSPINFTVPANGTVTVPLSTWARSSGSFLRSTEPVDIRGIAYFEGPSGSFIRQFTTMLPQ
jgi:hypothetical protein